MSFLLIVFLAQVPAPLPADLGLPSPDEMAANALSVAEENLPQISMVGLSIFIVRKMLNEM